MIPLTGSFPRLPNQSQPSAQQSSQPQLGMNNNPQIPIPFNGAAMAMPNMPNSMANQPGFMNGPNNHMGMTHLGSIGHIPGKTQAGFRPQCSGSNVNPVGSAPFSVHGFGHNNNMSGLPQFNSTGTGLPFGQFCLPNGLQGMNQFAAMQMAPNVPQFVPQNAFGPQAMVPQNPGFMVNPQFGNMHYNQVMHQLNQSHLHYNQMMGANSLNPSAVATEQLQGNSSNSNQTEQTNNNLQCGTQGNPPRTDGFNASRGNWKNHSNKNFASNPKRRMQQGGSQNSQFHQMRNGRKNSGFSNACGRGLNNEKPGHSKNQGRDQRRSLCLTYTEQEIQQWCEERRKNYPSKSNIEKKLADKALNKENIEKEAKIRHEKLKEILAKQAELGVEVAEIPGCNLSDQTNVGQGRGENGRPLGKNGRFQNRFDKRGRHDKKDWYSKKRRQNDNASNVPPLSTRKPSLLEKLLSSDMKRDKTHLLQAFRFMVLNSFFDGSADEPLKFPSVIVKDGSGQDTMAEEMHLNAGKDVSEVVDKTIIEEVDIDDDKDDSNDDGSDGEDDNKNND